MPAFPPLTLLGLALSPLFDAAEILTVRRRRILVAVVTDEQLDRLHEAIGAIEDLEDSDDDRNTGDEEVAPDDEGEYDTADWEPSLSGITFSAAGDDRDLEWSVDDEGEEEGAVL